MVARGDLGVDVPLEDVPAHPEGDHPPGPRGQGAGDRGHPDAGVDGHAPAADAGRGLRRLDGDLRRRRRHHALGGDGHRPLSRRGGRGDGAHRRARRAGRAGPGADAPPAHGRRGAWDSPRRSPTRPPRPPTCSTRAPSWRSPSRASRRASSPRSGPTCRSSRSRRSLEVQRRLALSWGVSSRLIRKVETTDEMIEEVEATLLGDGSVRINDVIVIISGSPMWVAGTTNLLKLHRDRRAPLKSSPRARSRSRPGRAGHGVGRWRAVPRAPSGCARRRHGRRLARRRRGAPAGRGRVADAPRGRASSRTTRAVMESVGRATIAAALARGAVRIRTLTLDGEADFVLIVDAEGVALAQPPPNLSPDPGPTPCFAAGDPQRGAPRLAAERVPAWRAAAIQSAEVAGPAWLARRPPSGTAGPRPGTPTVAWSPRSPALSASPSGAPDVPAGRDSGRSRGGRMACVAGAPTRHDPQGERGRSCPRASGRAERRWLWGALTGFLCAGRHGAASRCRLGRRPAPRRPAGSILPEAQRELEALYAAAVTMGSSVDLVAAAEQTSTSRWASPARSRHGLPAPARANTLVLLAGPRPDAGAARSRCSRAPRRPRMPARPCRPGRPVVTDLHDRTRAQRPGARGARRRGRGVSHPAGAADLRRRTACGACWRWSRPGRGASTTTC